MYAPNSHSPIQADEVDDKGKFLFSKSLFHSMGKMKLIKLCFMIFILSGGGYVRTGNPGKNQPNGRVIGPFTVLKGSRVMGQWRVSNGFSFVLENGEKWKFPIRVQF